MALAITTLCAGMFLIAGCDSGRDEPARPDTPRVAPGSGQGDSGPVTTGPKGEAQTLPAVPGGNQPSDSGRESVATNPAGPQTKVEEQKQMPEAGQANTHSSEALSKDVGTASDGEPRAKEGQGGAAPSTAADAPAGAAGGSGGTSSGASSGASPAGASSGGATQVAAAGDPEALMKKHNCVSCHATDKKLVGPAYKEVAAKYKGDASAADKLVDKVKKGGSGVWGPIPMPPNPAVPDGEVRALVDWILAGAD